MEARRARIPESLKIMLGICKRRGSQGNQWCRQNDEERRDWCSLTATRILEREDWEVSLVREVKGREGGIYTLSQEKKNAFRSFYFPRPYIVISDLYACWVDKWGRYSYCPTRNWRIKGALPATDFQNNDNNYNNEIRSSDLRTCRRRGCLSFIKLCGWIQGKRILILSVEWLTHWGTFISRKKSPLQRRRINYTSPCYDRHLDFFLLCIVIPRNSKFCHYTPH